MLSRRSFAALVLVFVSLVFVLNHRAGQLSVRPPSSSLDNAPVPPSPDVDASPQEPDLTNSTTSDPAVESLLDRPPDGLCDTFPDTSGILLVIKTGASEAFQKIPIQLMTTLKCLPEFLIFSDMEQRIAGHRIRDSLDTVLQEAKDKNSDFDIYRRQQKCQVDLESCIANDAQNTKDAWELDRYKFIHIAEKAYTLRPDYNWYVFIDADTYVLWYTMVQWLQQLDHRDKHYLGSISTLRGIPFGHGGSGYIVSKAAMEEFVGRHPGVANEWDVSMKRTCCGDYVFALAMEKSANTTIRGTVSGLYRCC